MSLPAYPRYMDSGVEWLGEVPEHWTVHPLKRAIAKIESGTSVNASDYPATPGSYGVLKTSCVYTGQFDWKENKTVDNEDLHRVSCPLKIDTLVVSRMNTPDLVGATGLVTEAPNGIFLPDRLWQVYLERRQSPSFIFYFTKSSEYREQVKIACSGTSSSMQNLGQDDFRSLLFVEPPTSEQTQIARFLDHETARIDALIEEQQRLIALLKEKRQAVISHSVTKGLDPKASMKDSRVEWLGEVPAYWDVLNFNLLVYIAEGQVNPKILPYSKLLLIAPNHVESATGRLLFRETAEEQGADSGKYLCQEGDVVYSKIRPALRKVCLAPIACICSADMYPMRGRSGLQNEYLYWFILSEPFSAFALLESDRVAMPKINRESLGGLRMARPPANEQKKIAAYLSRETQKIDTLIDEALSGVGLLSERRSALISAAVTGKIDVRGWQPPTSATSPELAQEAV